MVRHVKSSPNEGEQRDHHRPDPQEQRHRRDPRVPHDLRRHERRARRRGGLRRAGRRSRRRPCAPGAGGALQILAGELQFRVGKNTIVAKPGDRVLVPAGTAHKFENIGNETAHFVCEVSPALGFEQLIETMFSLAEDGKANKKGMPNPLRLAVVARHHFGECGCRSRPRGSSVSASPSARPSAASSGTRRPTSRPPRRRRPRSASSAPPRLLLARLLGRLARPSGVRPTFIPA